MLRIYETIVCFLVNYGYTLEMLLAVAVFAHSIERRRHFVLRAAGCYLAVLGCYSVMFHFLDGQGVWEELALYAAVNLLIYLSLIACFRTSGWVRLFVLIGADTTQHISFRIYSVILSFLGIGYGNIRAGILNCFIIAMVYLSVFLIFRRQMAEIDAHAYNGRANILLGVAVFAVAILIYRFEDQYDFVWIAPDINLMFSAYAVLSNAFLLAILYSVFRSRKMTDEMGMLEDLVERQKMQYELVKENMDNVNIKCHDMKQQISMFENRIDRDALQEIKSMINVYDTTFKTGNEVLDVFLQEKLLSCERDEIKLDCIVDGKSVAFIRPADLYTLVGNAIDNAIEAVRKIENPERRIITLAVRKKMNMVLMHVDNEYVGEIKMNGDLPRSTKGDAVNHGFGMRSMRMIAEKYGGTLTMTQQDHVFNLNILIPVPKQESGL